MADCFAYRIRPKNGIFVKQFQMQTAATRSFDLQTKYRAQRIMREYRMSCMAK